MVQGYGWLDALVSAVTLATAAIPEEFPVAFTFFLGLGVYRLARRHALVRRAVTVENMGRAILVGGGPAPGINAVIGAATIRAELEGMDVIGVRDRIRVADGVPRLPTGMDAFTRKPEAIAAYERALQLTTQQPERRFLLRRLAGLKGRS